MLHPWLRLKEPPDLPEYPYLSGSLRRAFLLAFSVFREIFAPISVGTLLREKLGHLQALDFTLKFQSDGDNYIPIYSLCVNRG